MKKKKKGHADRWDDAWRVLRVVRKDQLFEIAYYE